LDFCIQHSAFILRPNGRHTPGYWLAAVDSC
jgi:hypothetical protein